MTSSRLKPPFDDKKGTSNTRQLHLGSLEEAGTPARSSEKPLGRIVVSDLVKVYETAIGPRRVLDGVLFLRSRRRKNRYFGPKRFGQVYTR